MNLQSQMLMGGHAAHQHLALKIQYIETGYGSITS